VPIGEAANPRLEWTMLAMQYEPAR